MGPSSGSTVEVNHGPKPSVVSEYSSGRFVPDDFSACLSESIDPLDSVLGAKKTPTETPIVYLSAQM